MDQEIRIEPFRPQDAATVVAFVAALQDYEREFVAELKPGADIGQSYADLLLLTAAERGGVTLMARAGMQTIGFVCAFIDEDHDMLLREDARQHALISDIFVIAGWRRRGVARALLQAAEDAMRERGCRRIRIRSKAANHAAVIFYEHAGYRPYEIVFSKPIEER
jgi:GNAT superfamily N-acetyltransferase